MSFGPLTRVPLRRLLFRGAAAAGVVSLSGLRPVESRDSAELVETVERDRPLERAAWNAMLRRDSRGRILSENRLRALERACELPVDASMRASAVGSSGEVESPLAARTFGGAVWESLGPRPIQARAGADRAWGNVAGRISGLAVHPTDPSILLLASATGGIWKSTDAGATWRPVSDGAPAMAVSAVAFAPSNPRIAYAATGEVDQAGLESVPAQSLGTYLGAGVLRSNDAGDTWSRVDVDLPSNAVFSRVVVNPSDPQLVLLGVYLYQDLAANGYQSGGVYRSTDGGVHWTRTIRDRVSDLIGDPGDPQRVYIGAGRCGNCGESGVWVSTDFGATWSPSLTPSNPVATFTTPSGRVRLGATRAAGATVVYASVLDSDNRHAKGGIFRSDDGGASWVKVSVESTMCPAPPDLNQCSYDHWIAPEAGSSTTVYFGSIDLYKSGNSGSTWSKITRNYNASGIREPVHPDQHFGASSGDPGGFYFCNDGGLYRSRDGGQTFENLNATLTLAQFNGIALHPTNSELAMGGTQDNGNLRFTGPALWLDRTSGDGGFNLIRRDLPDQVLSANYFAFLQFSPDGGTSYSDATPCGILMDCSKQNPLESMSFYPPAAVAPSAPETVFLGTNRIWANSSFGSDPSKWQPRSSGSILHADADFLTAIEVVGDGGGIVWAGSSLGELLLSTDGGATFSARSSGLPSSIVTKIVAINPEQRVAYVTFGGFSGSAGGHVFRTVDGGLSWTDLSSNLPDVPVTAFAVDPSDGGDLFVGTDVGVFRTIDGGASWSAFRQGLPNVSVTDLKFHPISGDLYASTYGRGAFRIRFPVLPPFADFSPAVTPIVAGRPELFVDTSSNAPTAWAWSFGDPASGAANASSERNPKHVFSAPGTYSVRLTVSNAAGTSEVIHRVAVDSAGSCPRCRRLVPFR